MAPDTAHHPIPHLLPPDLDRPDSSPDNPLWSGTLPNNALAAIGEQVVAELDQAFHGPVAIHAAGHDEDIEGNVVVHGSISSASRSVADVPVTTDLRPRR